MNLNIFFTIRHWNTSNCHETRYKQTNLSKLKHYMYMYTSSLKYNKQHAQLLLILDSAMRLLYT